MSEPRLTDEQALAWIAEIFEEPEPVALDTPRESIPLWDSMGVLSLLAALDERFGIVLTDPEVKGLKTPGDIVALLRARGVAP